MTRSNWSDPSGDFGRQLTMDVATLSLALPVVAREAFATVVLPFVFAACLTLLVLFMTPFRDVPFVAQHATHGLSMIRTVALLVAIANLFLTGYASVASLSLRWAATTLIAVIGLATLMIDLRRVFSSR